MNSSLETTANSGRLYLSQAAIKNQPSHGNEIPLEVISVNGDKSVCCSSRHIDALQRENTTFFNLDECGSSSRNRSDRAKLYLIAGLPIGPVAEGSTVGVADGSAVGVADASIVGVAEASTVDVTDTSIVGVADASTVGVADSSTVGVTDSSTVGVPDASSDGVADASSDGVTD
eukprot:scaffold4420_cov107-Cylindrotheca_fusiformis.AAC.6